LFYLCFLQRKLLGCGRSRKRAPQLDPENTLWQRELSVAHRCVGTIYESLELLEESLAEYEAAAAISERLANHDPANAVWQEDLQDSRELVESARDSLANGRKNATTSFEN
jgi:hypothetical protein